MRATTSGKKYLYISTSYKASEHRSSLARENMARKARCAGAMRSLQRSRRSAVSPRRVQSDDIQFAEFQEDPACFTAEPKPSRYTSRVAYWG
jgi:hypothetical protein